MVVLCIAHRHSNAFTINIFVDINQMEKEMGFICPHIRASIHNNVFDTRIVSNNSCVGVKVKRVVRKNEKNNK